MFEYIVEHYIWWDGAADGHSQKLERYLNKYGMDGWELVETRPSRVKSLGDLFIFKRPG